MNRIFLPPEALHAGDLILVDAAHPYRERRCPELTGVPRFDAPIRLERRAAEALQSLMAALEGWGHILPVSGWRSRREQQTIWDTSLAENGPAFTRTYVALPGCSEHETGLAIDVGLAAEDLDLIRPRFPYQGISQTFRALAPAFGFIQRYPAGKESVTGIGHEPWHFRYVGRPHAAIMAERDLTLEEYLAFLRTQHEYITEVDGMETRVSYLPADPGGVTTLDLPQGWVCSVSGDNAQGFVITRQRTRHVRESLSRP